MSQWTSGGVAHSQETAGHSLADKHPVVTLQSNSGLKFGSCPTAVEKQEMQPQASVGRVLVMEACLKPFLICLKYGAVWQIDYHNKVSGFACCTALQFFQGLYHFSRHSLDIHSSAGVPVCICNLE